ncbi:hypothetical protein [Nannocystis pusilla]|uniref:hypothetical protein n=1 Tax=Nannocystis pusilla TaxID=889268 RepID=UPI003BF110A2
MADENKRADSAGAFISQVRDGVRQELEQEYAQRLRVAREEVRRAQDLADAQRICASQEQAQMAARMAEYRRGRWYHLGSVVASAVSGAVAGYHAQKALDVRARGVPVMAVAGIPGLVGGALLDEGMAARASLAVGGVMFSLGTAAYAACHPLPAEAEEKIV